MVSHDGHNPAVEDVINDAKAEFQRKSSLKFDHIHFVASENYENAYFRLASHYKYALNQAFASSDRVRQVIILEEDLQIAPDFFEFFAATSSLLDQDPDLLTISAWNDNGFEQQVHDNKQLYRSDFFPGLGWMMTKTLWSELEPKWPRAYWDDWLREPKQRKGRQIIRPEVCRTYHFGVKGVSNSQYSDYLQKIRLNDHYVAFTTMDLSYLQKDKWDQWYLSKVRAAKVVTPSSAEHVIAAMTDDQKEVGVRLLYNSLDANSREPDSFSTLARWSGAMDNVKAGVPRTAYKGVVSLYREGIKVHLVPKSFQ